MPNIKPVSDLRNYTTVVNEVKYGSRVYLTKNGNIDFIWNGFSITDERKEKVDFTKPYLKNKQIIITLAEKNLALYKFKYEMAVAEKSIKEEGTISADELEAELGIV